jgi:hypothetical protein
MIDLIFFTMACFGLVYCIGHSVVSLPVRRWIAGDPPKMAGPRFWLITLIECPACLGFWIGFVAGWFGYVPILVLLSPLHHPILAIAWGLYIAGTNYVLAKLTALI